ncbi:MAG: hypothetical protein A2X88_09720 [Deltaproteobacteria bacterium GWC2_65_14]|nr:MAG: hypothetical protein A2X88_09720 [Deltaproteobacteria bacterium GWC2_65_14]
MRLPARSWTPLTLFLLALGACLVFIVSFPLPEVKNDAVEYLALARNVAAGAGFSYDGATPAVYRPPLFSLLLGGWFAATGTSSVLSAAVFQSLVHALGVLAAFLLFLEVTRSRGWAFGGAIFLAVNPLLVTRVVFVLQEPTLLLFTTLAAWLSIRLVKALSPGRAALAGAAWGLATLAKTVTGFAPFLLLGMGLLPGRWRVSWRGWEAAALLVCFAAVIAPWTVRNYLHVQRFIVVNDQGEGLLEWNVEHADPSGERLVAELREKGVHGAERRAALWRYVRENPWHFLGERVVKNAVRFAAPPRDWWIAQGLVRPGEHRTSFWILSGLFHMPLYLFLLFRTWQWARGSVDPVFGFLALLYWSYWIEHAILWGDPRFGLAVYPLLVCMVLPVGRGEGKGRIAPLIEEPEPAAV